MKLEDINIRDPFILPWEGTYYLYGTRSATCWGKAEGFDCYTSRDLENWEGPTEIFHRPKDLPLDENYWAPECYVIDGWFYFLTTLGGEHTKKGLYWLSSDSPVGPFSLYSGRLTPEDWTCIDGTLYREDGRDYMVFSRSFEDSPEGGTICLAELSADRKTAVSEPVILFHAKEADWTVPVPFAKEEFGIEGDVYFSDGPFLVKEKDGSLRMLWSSWGERGYAVGEAVSKTGSVFGPWTQIKKPFFPENGGHGMIFRRFDGKRMYVLHYPDDKYKEHPLFTPLED